MMKRNYPIPPTCPINNQELIRQTAAFHATGHAAAIYLDNKQKQLPPVFFQITIKAWDRPKNSPLDKGLLAHEHFVGVVECG
jgi:hypothetical protein